MRLLLITIMTIFCSCSTSRNTTDYKEQERDSLVTSVSHNELMRLQDAIKQDENRDISVRVIYYDTAKKPDSLGNYPKEKEVIIVDKTITNTDVKSERSDTISRITVQRYDHSKDIIDKSKASKESSAKDIKTILFTSLAILLLLIMIGLIIYIKVKHS